LQQSGLKTETLFLSPNLPLYMAKKQWYTEGVPSLVLIVRNHERDKECSLRLIEKDGLVEGKFLAFICFSLFLLSYFFSLIYNGSPIHTYQSFS